jgi:DNA-binding NtrC family response regulator
VTDRFQPLEIAVFTAYSVTTYPLPPSGRSTIGRGEDNDIRVADPTVSKRHAILHMGPPMRIEDAGSANGIRILAHRETAGTARLVETRLPPGGSMEIALGDGITIGATLITIRRDEGDSKPVSSRVARSFVAPVIRDQKMRQLYEMVDRVAQGPISVLLLGETGVGKEVMAEAIHRRSPRSRGPFVALNCAALSESLLESELFGHEAGAFTGANRTKPGLFETAEGGTVFLDEVGELPLPIQVKLLRVLEERKVLRVGGLARRPINVRFISATNRDLEAEATRGTFRQDLYFRLNGISLIIPPLRERVPEIEPLAKTFIAKACAQMRLRTPPELSREALEALERHAWPGNIRELRNVIERSVVLCTGDRILPDHLGIDRVASRVEPSFPKVDPSHQTLQTTPPPISPMPSMIPITMPRDSRALSAPVTLPSGVSAAPLKAEMEELERKRIMDALEQCGGNQTQAAELLGMSRRTLVARLSGYGLTKPRKKAT